MNIAGLDQAVSVVAFGLKDPAVRLLSTLVAFSIGLASLSAAHLLTYCTCHVINKGLSKRLLILIYKG